MSDKLTVGDLYCGAGGFAEGFRQAGFRVAWGLDNWGPAVMTFQKNFPSAKTLNRDILAVELRELEPVDVLIGSPPCQFFSLANKGGNGDYIHGLKFVSKFLEAVKVLKPKYWVMENVANLKPKLERALQAGSMGFAKEDAERYFPIDGFCVFDASEYGAPQRRRRLFSGRFPPPKVSLTPKVSLGEVVHALPVPILEPARSAKEVVRDPLYRGVKVRVARLADHFMDTILDGHQLASAERAKQHHIWAGRMNFPDLMGEPSRTICTSSDKSGRQAIVIPDDRLGALRAPTLRECASLQGFPITFQFWGSTVTAKQTLIGNAVPPPLSRAIALSIREDLGRPYHGALKIRAPKEFPPAVAEPKQGKPRHRFPLLRPYRSFVPGTLRYCRVDLDNKGKSPRNHPAGAGQHIVRWRTVLYLGYAKDYASFELDVPIACRIAEVVAASTLDAHLSEDVVGRACREAASMFLGTVPDASTLQAVWSERSGSGHNPDWIVRRAGDIAEGVVGKPSREVGVRARMIAPLLEGRFLVGGKECDTNRWQEEIVDPYTAASAVALAIATLIANEGASWIGANWGRQYNGGLIELPETPPRDLQVSRDKEMLVGYMPTSA